MQRGLLGSLEREGYKKDEWAGRGEGEATEGGEGRKGGFHTHIELKVNCMGTPNTL